MENFDLILGMSNPLDITYELREGRGPPSAERRTQRELTREERGNNPIVAVVAEVVRRQPASLFGGRHKDSLLG